MDVMLNFLVNVSTDWDASMDLQEDRSSKSFLEQTIVAMSLFKSLLNHLILKKKKSNKRRFLELT